MSHLTHIALHVEDLDACINFYQDYCGMHIVHERVDNDSRIVWLAEEGREKEMILVMMPKGRRQKPPVNDYSHLGFAVESKARVDEIATKAKDDGRLVWPPVQEPFPVGYYCGVQDPNGTMVEFSYGQPLGPGAPE